MSCSHKNIFKKTPLTAKKIGGMFALISTGIGTLGYLTHMDIYVHVGAISLILSIVIPTLFAEDESTNS